MHPQDQQLWLNQSAIAMTKNPQSHGRTKHIDNKYHFIRDQVSKGTISLKYWATEDITADVFTKALSHERFWKLREMIGIKQIPEHYTLK